MPAFISGGVVPSQRRGTVLTGYVSIVDWYSTFASLAGVDPTDSRAAKHGLPPSNSVNMHSYLLGEGAAPRVSPRPEVLISVAGIQARGTQFSEPVHVQKVGMIQVRFHVWPAIPVFQIVSTI